MPSAGTLNIPEVTRPALPPRPTILLRNSVPASSMGNKPSEFLGTWMFPTAVQLTTSAAVLVTFTLSAPGAGVTAEHAVNRTKQIDAAKKPQIRRCIATSTESVLTKYLSEDLNAYR